MLKRSHYRKPQTRLVGRKILCGHCNRKTVFGKIGVLNKVVFFFCSKCWESDPAGCIKQMKGAASIEASA